MICVRALAGAEPHHHEDYDDIMTLPFYETHETHHMTGCLMHRVILVIMRTRHQLAVISFTV